ncbi:hypothetical protein [Arthrobacter sp.]|uniref:hypothetical protein n=1 Tax=Arthrobacter sp. TaxID=1667 RepID=UPI003A8DC94B
MSKKPAQRRKKPRNRQSTSSRGTATRPASTPAGPVPRPGSALANTTTGRTPEQAQGNGNLILWAGLGAAVLLFWYYHLVVLHQMQDLAGGLAMPDQMIGGYRLPHIEQLRSHMDADARGQLSYVHKTAGTLFPLFLSLVTMLTIALHVPRRGLRWALWAVPLVFAIVDLWDNPLIDGLLSGPVDAASVATASALTVASWYLLFATVATGLGVVITAFVRTFRRKWSEAGLS